MGLIHLVVILLVVGLILYLVQLAPFIDATMKQIIRWVIIVVVLIWLLTIFVGDITLPRLRN